MAEPTATRPGIDPILQTLLDAFPLEIKVADGVEAARQKMRQIEPPAELLPTMRIEERTIDFGDLTGIPVRIYWPPIPAHDDLPVVVGGIIPEADAVRLRAMGVAAVYTPKDFELNRIMMDIVALVDRQAVAAE